MELFLAASFLGFVSMSLFVGVRLMLVWRRTRQLPELLLGLSSLLLGGITYPVGAAVASGQIEVSAFWRVWLSNGANLAGHLGYALVLLFTIKVFRPDDVWASRAQWLIWAVQSFALCAFGLALVRTGGHYEETAAWVSCVNLIGPILIFGWTCFESLGAYRMARRRVALGLSDAVIANRMLMWAGFAGAIALGALQSFVCESQDLPYMHLDWARGTIALLGLAEAVFLLLAFFPPAAYQGWLREGAQAHA